jgi:hypothetical protein
MNLGFERDQVVGALRATAGNAPAAAELLLSGGLGP